MNVTANPNILESDCFVENGTIRNIHAVAEECVCAKKYTWKHTQSALKPIKLATTHKKVKITKNGLNSACAKRAQSWKMHTIRLNNIKFDCSNYIDENSAWIHKMRSNPRSWFTVNGQYKMTRTFHVKIVSCCKLFNIRFEFAASYRENFFLQRMQSGIVCWVSQFKA